MMKLKAQAAVMDGFFFMLICGAAATLMFYTTGLYGASTNRQIITIYNYEYEGTALVTLHYAKDAAGQWFWLQMKDKLASNQPPPNDPKGLVMNYFNNANGASKIWDKIVETSPSQHPVLYFSGPSSFYCYEDNNAVACEGALPDGPEPALDLTEMTVFASSVNLVDNSYDKWEVALQMYY